MLILHNCIHTDWIFRFHLFLKSILHLHILLQFCPGGSRLSASLETLEHWQTWPRSSASLYLLLLTWMVPSVIHTFTSLTPCDYWSPLPRAISPVFVSSKLKIKGLNGYLRASQISWSPEAEGKEMATGALLLLPSPAITSSHAMYNVTPERKKGKLLKATPANVQCTSAAGFHVSFPFGLPAHVGPTSLCVTHRGVGSSSRLVTWQCATSDIHRPSLYVAPHRRNLYLGTFWLRFVSLALFSPFASFSCRLTFNPVFRLAQEVRNRRRKRVVDLIWKIWGLRFSGKCICGFYFFQVRLCLCKFLVLVSV